MRVRIWFVANAEAALACFESKAEAVDYMDQFSEEDDFDDYEIYDIAVDDLEDYPDEYELAIEEGIL